MIFLTVGSQLPFDRLTRVVDDWAAAHPDVDVLAQIGVGGFVPRHVRSLPTMSPTDYREAFERASLVIAHAGMGTIITALELRKPLLMLPRLASLRESRNDNQVGTARHFSQFSLFEVVDSETEIAQAVDCMRSDTERYVSPQIGFGVSNTLINKIREFVAKPNQR
jgi:UDP-N-acetylglucosamine transferase subunit ALG13